MAEPEVIMFSWLKVEKLSNFRPACSNQVFSRWEFSGEEVP